MNTPTKQLFRLADSTECIHLRKMLITEIKITQEEPIILYQVPFELTTAPHRAWKEIFMDSWQYVTQHKGGISETVAWVYHNRILINNIPIELVKNNLEKLLNTAIEKTNSEIALRTQPAI